jgi:hypothetical protein
MKKIFKQHLYDYLYQILLERNLQLDWTCEKELNFLIEISIDRISHLDCTKEEMLHLAKTNMLHLLNQMYLDSKARALYYVDALSISNALSQSHRLWPYKTADGWQEPAPTDKHEVLKRETYYQ